MSNNAQNIMFAAPPSDGNVANVVASQSRTLYLNNPRGHKPEEDSTVPADPDNGTLQDGKTSLEPTHDWQKRYSDLQSHTAKQLKSATEEKDELVRQLREKDNALEVAKKQPVKLPSTPQEVQEFKQKYGTLYNIMETMILSNNLTTTAELQKAIKETDDRTQRLAAHRAMSELLNIHPDAETLKNDPEFISWYKSQPKPIKALIESIDVQEVARGLDIYKKDRGFIQKTPQQKIADNRAAAMAINTQPMVEVGNQGGRIWRASEIKRMPVSVFGKYEAEILKAMSEGRYDENS